MGTAGGSQIQAAVVLYWLNRENESNQEGRRSLLSIPPPKVDEGGSSSPLDLVRILRSGGALGSRTPCFGST